MFICSDRAGFFHLFRIFQIVHWLMICVIFGLVIIFGVILFTAVTVGNCATSGIDPIRNLMLKKIPCWKRRRLFQQWIFFNIKFLRSIAKSKLNQFFIFGDRSKIGTRISRYSTEKIVDNYGEEQPTAEESVDRLGSLCHLGIQYSYRGENVI